MSELKTHNISFAYKEKTVLKNINLSFNGNNLVSIIGPNGAGKSTLLYLLQGILNPISGEIFLNNKSLVNWTRQDLAKEITLVSQFNNLVFPFSVMEVVLMGRHPYQGIFGFDNKDDIEIAVQTLKITDSYMFKDRYFNELSGGERQRILIARALAQATPIMLFDEPTSSLDLKYQKFIYELLKKLVREERKNIIVVSHDINLSSSFSDRIVLLKDGVVFKDGEPQEILKEEILKEIYETEISIEQSKSGPPFVRILPDSVN